MDPLSPLTAPPPRYLLESDSSDEEGQGLYPSSSSPRSPRATYEVNLKLGDGSSGPVEAESVVIGIGQAGRYLARKASVRSVPCALQLQVKGNGKSSTIGQGWNVGETLLLGVEEGDDYTLIWKIAEALKKGIKARKWTVVTTYVPAMYIPDPDSMPSTDSPIRSLQVLPPGRDDNLDRWDSPNYLTGLAAAVASLAAHPSSEWTAPLSILVLPLPLSSIPNSTLIPNITFTSARFARHLQSASSSPWGEADDEPFSAPGMGAGRNHNAAKQDVGTMYL